MDSFAVASSPFLLDSDFHSPRSNHFDLSPHSPSPYDSFDYQEGSHFPHTPSYNGSYQNSPYTGNVDLPVFDSGATDSLGLFPENPSGTAFNDDYDPSQYDLPNTSHTFITVDDASCSPDGNPQVSVSVTPPYDYNSPFDHSSPGSSNGGDDGRISRASSSSSYMHPASPRLDLPSTFEGMSFNSPYHPPSELPLDGPSPSMHKPPSPPQLIIPTSPSASGMDSPPAINAPDGDGLSSGPQLHIVPATPISGGGGMVANVPFQATLANLQGGQQQNAPSGWDPARQHLSPQPPNQSSQFADQASFNFTGSHQDQNSPGMSFGSTGAGGVESQIRPVPSNDQQQQSQGANYLVPTMQRSRSLSDTSLRPPVWDTIPSSSNQGSSARLDGNLAASHGGGRGATLGTVNMNDVLPGPSGSSSSSLHSPPLRLSSSAGPHQTSFGQVPTNSQNTPPPGYRPAHLGQHFTFGPGTSSSNNLSPQSNYLSPDINISAANLRRVKSDSRGHRQVRSEDIRHTIQPHHNSGMLFPPPSSTAQEILSQQRVYLHPSETIPSIASRGHHHRRSSSGSRERPPMGAWSSAASSARASPYPSPSASPRPGYGALPSSPLPDMMPSIGSQRRGGMPVDMMDMHSATHMNMVGGGMGMGMGGMSGMNGSMGGVGIGDMNGVGGGGGGGGMTMMAVAKVNVTTPSTADASQKRRKQPANFVCPVPGCGSTFTRHFNLKGHLRSHAEEKPFECKWPGCTKAFARQHDCKRHENLHMNIRPYPCAGCKKPFARMDALNRHLRSEGGAECRKIQQEVSAASGADSATDLSDGNGEDPSQQQHQQAHSRQASGQQQQHLQQQQQQQQGQGVGVGVGGMNTSMKPEPDGGWTGMSTMGGGLVM